jgi:hypothetical protein
VAKSVFERVVAFAEQDRYKTMRLTVEDGQQLAGLADVQDAAEAARQSSVSNGSPWMYIQRGGTLVDPAAPANNNVGMHVTKLTTTYQWALELEEAGPPQSGKPLASAWRYTTVAGVPVEGLIDPEGRNFQTAHSIRFLQMRDRKTGKWTSFTEVPAYITRTTLAPDMPPALGDDADVPF